MNEHGIIQLPQHIAIIMDGNGRWAKKRFMPRFVGHKKGLENLEKIANACSDRGIKHLTLFAFSSENWRRPPDEVSFLMDLFASLLHKYALKAHKNNIKVCFIGAQERFSDAIKKSIVKAETLTTNNTGMTLNIAVNYGGKWDIVQAANRLLATGCAEITEENLQQYLCLADIPPPDLFIRTGGEERISNFLLWQLAYAELYFTDIFWPAFDDKELDKAIASFRERERRFGRTSEQLPIEEQRS